MSTKTETTNVESVELDLDELLGTGSSSVMLADEIKPEKKSIFSPLHADTTFLDKVGQPAKEKTPEEIEAAEKELAIENEGKTPEEIEAAEAAAKALDDEDIFANPNPAETEVATDTSNLLEGTQSLIKKGLISLYEGDDRELKDYSADEISELFQANFDAKEEAIKKSAPIEFFQSLPPEMQHAYKYISDGGQDLKGLFKELASSVEIKDLDISEEKGQRRAVRDYFLATGYGTADEIDEEIEDLADRGALEKKAKQFKPKLDAMQEQVVEQKMKNQEGERKQRQAQSQKYIDSVYTSLETGKLGEVDIDNKTQNMLYSGLVQSNYTTASGQPTNMLGHLLEKYQWKEPNHNLIAEALWLLADRDGYRKSMSSVKEKEIAAKTLKTLKTEQASKGSSTQIEEKEEAGGRRKLTINKQKVNFFGRG